MRKWIVAALVTIAVVTVGVMVVVNRGGLGDPADQGLTHVVVALDRPPATLDPVAVMDSHSLAAALVCHAALGVVDAEGAIQPVLAKRIEMAGDGLLCEIELRDGLEFWDSSPVTADDVVASIERLRRSGHPHTWILDSIDGVVAFDDKSVDHIAGIEPSGRSSIRIRFATPDPDFSKFICSSALMVTKQGSEGGEKKPFDSGIIGCGPFVPDEIDPGTRITFRRNKGFPFPSKLETLEIRFVESPQAQLSGREMGEIHVVRLRGPILGEALSSDANGKLRPAERFSNSRVENSRASELTFLALNFSKGPLAAVPPAERKSWQAALSFGLDRERLVQGSYMKVAAQPAWSIVPPTVLSAQPPGDESRRQVEPITLELLCPNDPDSRRLGQYIQSQAKTIGIEFRLVHVELAELAGRLIGGGHEAALLYIENQIPAGVVPWTNFFREDHPMVALAQAIPDVKEEQSQARSTLDSIERADAYRKLARRIDEQQTVWIPIMSRNTVFLVDDRLDGVLLDANGLLWMCDLTSKE